MTLNSNALTTVERVVSVLKTYPFIATGIDFNDQDVIDEITRLINVWSSYICEMTNNDFGLKEYTEFYKGSNHPTITLKHYPVHEITSMEVVSGNGEVTGTIDVEGMMAMMGDMDLAHGLLYLEPRVVQRFTTVGIIPEKFVSLRSLRIKYTAGYVLPKDATELIPSTVPSALENLVVELARTQFIDNTDSIRANNLITLTEGNVQRMWAEPKEFKLTSMQEKIISVFKRKGV